MHPCIHAAHISLAFFTWRCLSKADGLPWCLGRGTVDDNLLAFLADPEPTEPLAQCLYWLLKHRTINWALAKKALHAMLHIPWNQRPAEQLHASIAAAARLPRRPIG